MSIWYFNEGEATLTFIWLQYQMYRCALTTALGAAHSL